VRAWMADRYWSHYNGAAKSWHPANGQQSSMESWSSQQWQLRARCQSSALVPPTPPPPPPPPVVAPPPPPTNQQPSKRLACNKFAIGGPSKTKIAKWNRSMVRLAKHKAKLVKERIAATASNSSATADPPDRPRTAEPPDQHVWEV